MSATGQRPCERPLIMRTLGTPTRACHPSESSMDLIASAYVAADNILDYSVSPPATDAVLAEHIVRIPRCQVLAVGNLSNVEALDYPFEHVPLAPLHLRIGAHVFVGVRDGGTGVWEQTLPALVESSDCRAVSFRVYV